MRDWVLGLLVSAFILSQVVTAQAATTVYVSPATVSTVLGSSFIVTINMSTDNSTYAAQFDVHYDKTKLNATSATEGNFLKSDGASTYPVINNNYTSGIINFGSTRFGIVTGVTGSGSLLVVNFSAIAISASSIGLAAVTIVDPALNPITVSSVTNGTVSVNRLPTASNLQISPASPKKADSLTGSYTYSDPDGNAESGSETMWYNDGVLQPACNNLKIVPPGTTAKGQRWYFTVKPKDGISFGAISTSANVTIQNTAPIAPAVAVLPVSPKKTDNIFCNITTASTDADGDAIAYSYAWYKNSVLQAGLIINTVTSGNLSKTQVWLCNVTPSDGSSNGSSGSNGVVIANSAPAITWFSPAGAMLKTREGFTLQFNQTSGDNDLDALTYSWKLDAVQKAATASWMYSPLATDCGNRTVLLAVGDGTATVNTTWNVSVTLRGDVNSDRKVDILDLASVGLAYGSVTGGANWNANADLNTGPKTDGTPEGDGKIDVFDLATVGINFGKSC